MSSSSDEKKNSPMTTSFVTHCASPAISPIAEAAGGTATESVIERSFVVVSKQGGSDGAKVDDEVASVLLTTERQDSGTQTSAGFASTQLNYGKFQNLCRDSALSHHQRHLCPREEHFSRRSSCESGRGKEAGVVGQTDGTSEPEEAVLAGKEALVVRTQEDSLLLFLSCAAGLHGLGTDFYPLLQ